jgi:hypothetical protein
VKRLVVIARVEPEMLIVGGESGSPRYERASKAGMLLGVRGTWGECEVNGVFNAAWKHRQEPNVFFACQRGVLVWR